MEEFTMDSFTNTEAESTPAEVIETTAETTTPEAESPAEVAPETTEEITPAESGELFTPDLNYKIKDEELQIPEFLAGSLTSKEQRDEIVDYLTKANALDGVKESRTAIETEFTGYKQQIEDHIGPVINKMKDFDTAVATKDFGKAWELADQKPEDMVDYMLMNENLSQMLYKKMHEHIALEEQGPQAVASNRAAYQETQKSSQLEQENQSLNNRLQNMEREQYDSMLSFGLSQNQEAVSQYDTVKGAGAFEQFAKNYTNMQAAQGVKISPMQAISEVASMLNLGQPVPTNTIPGTPAAVAPVQPITPAVLPNTGTGVNQSVVSKVANDWGEWEKQMQAG